LVGKIDRRFEMRQEPQQPVAPAAVERAEMTVELAQGLAALRLGLGGGEIGHRLRLRQVELAVVKGAAGEFAGLGEAQPEAGERRQCRAGVRPGQADDGDRGAPRRRRRGIYRVGGGLVRRQCFGGSWSGVSISRSTRPPFLTWTSRISSMSCWFS